ncbi:hypothetical protein ANCCAN_25241 [Ancylostoma caninum]|uniref:Amino acid permease/ SLC12A domain-containing protein n=1 Tax=Ancylostoma caninum TaxID=29170 RepID=A0A368FDZ0_ANCCA|nr:hypothetical protein ANCCAN_25241 [Ancylostoma caninum]
MFNGADKRRNGPTLSESEDNELLSEHTSEHECQPSTAAIAATSNQPNGSRFTLNVESHPLSHHDSIISRQSSHRELFSWGGKDAGNHNLALFEEPSMPFFSSYLKAHTTPGPLERAQSENQKKKADLGVMLGVYLPTIQHILGVTMFIRLFWVVGIAGLGQTFLLLFLCCLCVSNLPIHNRLYIFPGLTIGGPEVHSQTDTFGMMTNNLRFYSTLLLLLEFLIVAMGVKFVQMLAPVSLVCVILSILACYAGGIEKTLNPDAGQRVCMYGDHLLQSKFVIPKDNGSIFDMCDFCNTR